MWRADYFDMRSQLRRLVGPAQDSVRLVTPIRAFESLERVVSDLCSLGAAWLE
jgi:hypothetical protein